MKNTILKSSEVNRTEHLLRKLTQIIFVVVFSLSLLSGDRRDLWIAIPSGLLILFMIYQMVCIIRLEETSIQYIDGKIKIKAFKNIYSPRLVTKTLQAEDVKSESLEEHLFIRSGYEHQTLKYILKSGEEIFTRPAVHAYSYISFQSWCFGLPSWFGGVIIRNVLKKPVRGKKQSKFFSTHMERLIFCSSPSLLSVTAPVGLS